MLVLKAFSGCLATTCIPLESPELAANGCSSLPNFLSIGRPKAVDARKWKRKRTDRILPTALELLFMAVGCKDWNGVVKRVAQIYSTLTFSHMLHMINQQEDDQLRSRCMPKKINFSKLSIRLMIDLVFLPSEQIIAR